MYKEIEIPVTREQIIEIKNIKASTRYEALDKVAEILGAKIGYRKTWGGTTRKTIVIEGNTVDKINKIRGTKYVLSEKGDVFKTIQEYLNNNETE